MKYDEEFMKDFREKVDEHHEWPCVYMFKFIVKADSQGLVEEKLPEGMISTRKSRNGKYVSITAEVVCDSADRVVEIYKAVSSVPGVMSL